MVYAPDGSKTTASAFFNVLPAASSQPVIQPANQQNWLAGNFEFELAGNQVSINRGVGLVVGGLGAWAVLSALKTKRR